MAIFTRPTQPLAVLTKYASWFAGIIICFSCQRNLTQTDSAQNISSVSLEIETPSEKFVSIDTSEYAISNRVSMLSSLDSQVYKRVQDKIQRFYLANALKTKWLEESNPGTLYNVLLDHLKNASRYGLNPEAYGIEHLVQRVNRLYQNKSVASTDIVDVDMQITETFFHFALHLREGRISDRGYRGKIWIVKDRKINDSDVARLSSVKNSAELDRLIKDLQPSHEQYARLQKALELYRTLERTGETRFAANDNIKPGKKYAAIPAIRKKLSLMEIYIHEDGNDNTAKLADSLYYDETMASAVKIFQERHGLEPNGVIEGKTIAFLNQSFKEKADLIALNMERLRWLPETYGEHYIAVNIPEYKLRIYEKAVNTLEMKVIVGAIHSATPIFTDTLEHAVFSPTWTVPPSIVKEEFLPRLKKNSAYYANRDFTFFKKGVEIDPSTERWDSASNINQYTIVQKPGPGNSLGLVKFIMPNRMNVYLHDTPDHRPFSNTYRALSHGCIRLDDPAKFAAYLLQNEPDWDLKNINKAMTSRKPTKIVLRKSYPVHLEYNTVWVDDNGSLNFREDIYGHDKRHLQRLAEVNKPAPVVAVL